MVQRLSSWRQTAAQFMQTHWALLIVLTIGVSFCLRAVDGFNSIPGNVGDARFNSVLLEHFYLWVRGVDKSFWDPGFFFPFTNVLAFSDNHLGSGPVYAFLRFIGFERMTAFQIWIVVGQLTTFASAYISFRLLGFSSIPAAFGALIFTFSPTVLAKFGHAQLLYRFGTPLAFSMLWLALRDARPERMGWVVVWTVWQFLCSIYLGVFLAFLLAATLIAFLAFVGLKPILAMTGNLRLLTKRQSLILAIQVIGGTAVLLSVLMQYALTQSLYGFERSFSDIWTMLPRLQSYLLADQSRIWGDYSRTIGESLPARHEHQMFFGGLATILFTLAFLRRSKAEWEANLFKVGVGALAILFVMTLVIDPSYTLYKWLYELPGVGSIRAVSRISLVMVFLVALVSTVALEGIIRSNRLPTSGVVLSLSLASFIELQSYQPELTPKAIWATRIDKLKAALPDPFPSDAVLFATANKFEGFGPLELELDAMIVAQDLRIPTLNGYSGNVPPGYLIPIECLDPGVRIKQAAPYIQRNAGSIESIVQRVVIVSTKPCDQDDYSLVSEGPIDQSIADELLLSIAATGKSNNYKVTIFNGSSEPFITASSTNTPVSISWRYTYKGDVAPVRWDTRIPLGFTIAPSQTRELQIELPPPPSPEQNTIEISLVQDGYFWFHDAGMLIPSTSVTNKN